MKLRELLDRLKEFDPDSVVAFEVESDSFDCDDLEVQEITCNGGVVLIALASDDDGWDDDDEEDDEWGDDDDEEEEDEEDDE